MDFSNAVKGCRAPYVDDIRSHAELELGRQLSRLEETRLFQKISPENVKDRVNKVRFLDN